MSTARLLDGMPLPGDLYPDTPGYRPSVSLHRLRNAPPFDEATPGERTCASCGSNWVTETREHYHGTDPLRHGEYRTRVTCSEPDCGDEVIGEDQE